MIVQVSQTVKSSQALDTQLCDFHLQLLGDRGIFLTDQNALLVSDLHLGKEATFRRHGIPVPNGSTHGTLNTVAAMIASTNATHLIVLGDLFHARSSLSDHVCDAMQSFLQQHRSTRFSLVVGNHDRSVGRLPSDWPINVVGERLRLAGLTLTHAPDVADDEETLRICGHVHPAFQLNSRTESIGNLPCFWYSRRCLVMPAVGEFTGTCQVRPRTGDRIWVVADGKVAEVACP